MGHHAARSSMALKNRDLKTKVCLKKVPSIKGLSTLVQAQITEARICSHSSRGILMECLLGRLSV